MARTFTFDAPAHHRLVESDGKGGEKLLAYGGEKFSVTEARAVELIAAGISLAESKEELSKMARTKLNEIAQSLGIADPESFASKDALIEAIDNPEQPQADPPLPNEPEGGSA